MRLIDADELRTYIDGYIGRKKLSEHERLYLEGFKQIIDNAPTVSEITKEKLSIAYDQGYEDGKKNWLQEERPQGEWIETRGEYVRDNIYKVVLKCSNCGHICSYYGNICGNCGAEMRPKSNQLRDCENCIHHSDSGCEVWECEFEKRSDL